MPMCLKHKIGDTEKCPVDTNHKSVQHAQCLDINEWFRNIEVNTVIVEDLLTSVYTNWYKIVFMQSFEYCHV